MIYDRHFDNVREELPLNEFLNYESENDGFAFTETVHIFPDKENESITVYRLIGDTSENNYDRIRTTIENVRINTSTFADSLSGTLRNWCFQGGDGETILTFLAALKCERSDATLNIQYYEENNSPMIDESVLDSESFRISYETTTGRSNEVTIRSMWKVDTHKNANFL